MVPEWRACTGRGDHVSGVRRVYLRSRGWMGWRLETIACVPVALQPSSHTRLHGGEIRRLRAQIVPAVLPNSWPRPSSRVRPCLLRSSHIAAEGTEPPRGHAANPPAGYAHALARPRRPCDWLRASASSPALFERRSRHPNATIPKDVVTMLDPRLAPRPLALV
eukprot:scaffold52638_cov30-Tisochrysis_lutea.AAC.2